MGTDFEQFQGLTPDKKITELRKLIDNLNKEISDKQKEIQEAEKLISLTEDEERVLQRKAEPKTLEKKTEEPDEAEDLERLVATAPKQEAIHKAAHKPIDELYGTLRNIYDRQRETGIETEQDRDMVYAIRKGIEVKKEEGYKPATAKAQHLMTAAEQMAEHMYKGTGQYKS